MKSITSLWLSGLTDLSVPGGHTVRSTRRVLVERKPGGASFSSGCLPVVGPTFLPVRLHPSSHGPQTFGRGQTGGSGAGYLDAKQWARG